MKKVLLGLVVVLLGVGGYVFMNSKDTYDKSAFFFNGAVKVGQSIDFKLPDQFDKAHSLNNDTKYIIGSFAKETGHIMRNYLKTKDNNFLNNKKAYFIADISPMPVVIRNMFAMPDLKKSDYPVLLVYDKNISTKLKNEDKKEKIMLIELDSKKVVNIEYFTQTSKVDSL
jgi:uncharacterized protein YxeA